jgi:WD40 repeat protein
MNSPMSKSDQVYVIRHLAVSPSGNVLAAGEFERTVHLWNLKTRKFLRTIDATLDFGGNRLVISNDGRILVAGAYIRHGIAAYSTKDGSLKWHRKDLKKVQIITFSGDQTKLFCCFDSAACLILDAATGKTLLTLHNAKKVWDNRWGTVRFIESKSGDHRLIDLTNGKTTTVSRITFTVYDTAFSKSSIAICEAGGPARCIELATGREIWRNNPPPGVHYGKLAFCESIRQFVGVHFNYENGTSGCVAQAFDDKGNVTDIANLGNPWEIEFCKSGTQLITNWGELVDVATGKMVAKLPFRVEPRKREEGRFTQLLTPSKRNRI